MEGLRIYIKWGHLISKRIKNLLPYMRILSIMLTCKYVKSCKFGYSMMLRKEAKKWSHRVRRKEGDQAKAQESQERT